MINIAATDLQNIRIPGGLDIDTVHKNPQLCCMNVHCWVLSSDGKSVLIQRRSQSTVTFPGKYDISLAGHMDADESPLAAMLREIKEEGDINLNGRLIEPTDALYVEEQGQCPDGKPCLHNQLVYLYFTFIDPHEIHRFSSESDVSKFEWWNLDTFALRAANPTSLRLVPHPSWYYHTVVKKLYELSRTRATMSA